MLMHDWEIILRQLSNNPVTTLELEALIRSSGIRCPDDLARALMSMRRKGLARGAVSSERGGWIWWVEDQEEK
jgi:hypothetical protein